MSDRPAAAALVLVQPDHRSGDHENSDCISLLGSVIGFPLGADTFSCFGDAFDALTQNAETPDRIDPAELKLIHVRTLCREILRLVRRNVPGVSAVEIPHEYEIRLDELWRKLQEWKSCLDAGRSPVAETPFENDLLSAFLSYCE